MAVRRKSQSFSGGTSSYRGVTHHPTGQAQLLSQCGGGLQSLCGVPIVLLAPEGFRAGAERSS